MPTFLFFCGCKGNEKVSYMQEKAFFSCIYEQILSLEQFLYFCLQILNLGSALHEVVTTVNQEIIRHGLDVVHHQAL